MNKYRTEQNKNGTPGEHFTKENFYETTETNYSTLLNLVKQI